MSPKPYLGPLRVGLLTVGVLVFGYGVYVGATIPEPPPNSDGVPTGFAVVYVLLVQSAGALVAQVGYALPPGGGRFRFGPLADSPAVVRAAAATAAFVTAVALVTAFGWVLPDSLPRVVTGTHAFLWFGAVAGSAVGVVLTAVVAVGTVLWRLARGEPVLDGAGA
ncbi:MAG: hypothetical protein ACOCQL_07025 [Halolamina sp.]